MQRLIQKILSLVLVLFLLVPSAALTNESEREQIEKGDVYDVFAGRLLQRGGVTQVPEWADAQTLFSRLDTGGEISYTEQLFLLSLSQYEWIFLNGLSGYSLSGKTLEKLYRTLSERTGALSVFDPDNALPEETRDILSILGITFQEDLSTDFAIPAAYDAGGRLLTSPAGVRAQTASAIILTQVPAGYKLDAANALTIIWPQLGEEPVWAQLYPRLISLSSPRVDVFERTAILSELCAYFHELQPEVIGEPLIDSTLYLDVQDELFRDGAAQSVRSFSLSPSVCVILTGKNMQLNVLDVVPSSANAQFVFRSADPSIATISSSGVVLAVSTGTTVIRVSAASCSRQILVTVNDPLATEAEEKAPRKTSKPAPRRTPRRTPKPSPTIADTPSPEPPAATPTPSPAPEATTSPTSTHAPATVPPTDSPTATLPPTTNAPPTDPPPTANAPSVNALPGNSPTAIAPTETISSSDTVSPAPEA